MTAARESGFDAALALYRANDLAGAAAMLEEVVQQEPERSEAWHLLGVVRSQTADLEGALAALGKAAALRPQDAELLGNLARLQIKRKRHDLAAPLLERAVALAPRDVELWRSLSLVKRRLDDIDGAIEAARRVQTLAPEDAMAAIDLGRLLARAGDPRGAHAQYERAAALKADSATIQIQLAESLRGLGQLAEARAAAARAVELDPNDASAHAVLGYVLRMMEDFQGAAAAIDRALALAPDLLLGHFYKGLLLNDLNDVDAAIAHLDRALALDAEHADLHWNRAVINIRRGRWREGFAEYEWRLRSQLFIGGPRPPLPVRPKPAEFAGKRVLLTAEQGIGDQMQFMRYAALVARAGGRPILEAAPELVALARTVPGAVDVVSRGEAPPPHDFSVPLMSLPYVFGTEIGTVPAAVPYLRPDPAAVAAWARRLDGSPRPRVGLAWQGNPQHLNDRNRSIALARLKPLIESLPAGWVSLQKGAGSEQVAAAGFSGRLLDAGPGLQDFADTAALLANLDLVVTIDSAVAHLAGALGRPVLLLLPWSPDFRWMLGRADTPWYPTMRLLRQARRRDWTLPLQAVRSAVEEELRRYRKVAPPTPEAPAIEDEAAAQRRYEQLREAGQWDEAAALLEAMLGRRPDDPVLLSELSVVERKRKRSEAALALARRAAASDAHFLPALLALGAALSDFDRTDEAADAYEKALAIEPRHEIALVNLSALRLRQGRSVEAEALGRQAVAVAPDRAHSHWHLALALLTNGNYPEGWAEYEWRWRTGLLDQEKRDWPWPEWQGEPLNGRRLLVHTEQGFGDALQFVRLLPMLKAKGATLLLEAQPELVPLFAGLGGIDRLIARGGPFPAVDFQVPLMSLPYRLGLTLENLPGPVPYLRAEPTRTTLWLDRLADQAPPRIGLCWQGGRGHEVDRWRSASLAELVPLLEAAPAASFLSLQKLDDRAEIAASGLAGRVRSVAAQLGDFADTAGLIANLDLVIAVDTAVGHLAGALGKPVWLLLARNADFRWLRDRSDSPWYPRHRLFRQRRAGEWRDPVARAAAELPEFLAEIRDFRTSAVRPHI